MKLNKINIYMEDGQVLMAHLPQDQAPDFFGGGMVQFSDAKGRLVHVNADKMDYSIQQEVDVDEIALADL